MSIRPESGSSANSPKRLRSNSTTPAKRRKQLISQRRRRALFSSMEKLEDRSLMAVDTITSLGAAVIESFDSMGAGLTLPSAWKISPSTATPAYGTAVSTVTQQASSGSSQTGGTYNWGTSATERAVGAMSSSGFASPNSLMAKINNGSGQTINTLTVAYAAERYRTNLTAASVSFFYSLDGTTWTAVSAGDIAASNFPNGASAFDFINPTVVNKSDITISGLNIANGADFYLRWSIATGATNSQGIGIDNVNVVGTATVVAPSFDIVDQTTTNFKPVSYTFPLSDDLPNNVSFSVVNNSNTTLIPTANIVVTGTGASRTVTITPAGTLGNANSRGTANITIRATDAEGGLFTDDNFTVTVNAAPVLSIGKTATGVPMTISGKAGDLVQIPIRLTANGVANIQGIDIVVLYDTNYLQLLPTSPPGPAPGPVSANGPSLYTPLGNADDLGKLSITFGRQAAVATGFNAEIGYINAIIKATAPVGTTPINMVKSATVNGSLRTTQINEGNIALGPEPTNATNDTLTDGVVTVTAGSNVAPTHVLPSGPIAGVEDTNVVLSDGISPAVNDTSSGNNYVTTTLSVASSLIGKFVEGSALTTAVVTLSNNDATVTISGQEDQVNLVLSTLEFAPAANRNGLITVTIQSNDTIATTTDTFQIDLAPVNDKPSFTVVGNQSVVNNAGAQTVNSFVNSTVFGPTSPSSEAAQTVVSFTRTSANSSLFSVQPTISAAGVLQYTPLAGQTGTATVTFTMKDSGGTDNGGVDVSDPVSFTITLTAPAGNANPVNTVPGPITSNEDVPVSFNGGNVISVADSDSASITTTVSAVGMGILTANNGTGTVTPGGSGSATITFTGAPTQINLALATLVFTPTTDRNSGDGLTTITVTSNDGAGGIDTDTISITLTPVNDQPSFTVGTVPSTPNTAGATTINGFATINKGATNESAQTVTFTRTSADSAVFSSQPVIDANGNLSFTPATGQSGTVAVTFTMKDSGGTANGGVDTSTPVTFNITITAAANQNPVNSVPAVSPTGTEDTPLNLSGANLIQVSDPDAGATNITVTVSVNFGTLAATGNGSGITPSNSGTSTVTFFGSQAQINQALQTLVLTPALNRNSSIGLTTITVQSNDGVGGTDTDSFNVTLTAVNDTPSFTLLGTQTVLEDAGAQTVTGFATANAGGGTDENGQTFTYNLSGNTNSALFTAGGQPTISPTGVLTYTPAPNANGSATITVSVTDSGSPAATSGTQTFTINVTAVNDTPSFTLLGTQTVLEDAGAQSVTGFATANAGGGTDENGQTFTYNLSGNTNSALFTASGQPTISPTGVLTYTPAPNANGSATITVSVTDSGSPAATSGTQTFTINVTAVNDTPTFTLLGTQTVLEDAGAQSVTGFATANAGGGSDENGQTFTYNLSGNTNSALFTAGGQPTISPTGVLTYTPAPNANGSATITVSVTDSGSPAATSGTQTFTINVTAVNDAPTFTLLGTQTVLEDAGAQSVTGFATANAGGGTDENGQTFTYNLSGNTNSALFTAGGQPTISPTGVLTYTPAPNANGSATITVSVTDSGSPAATSGTQTFTINVTAVNDAPSFTLLGTQTVLEDAGAQSVTGFATANAGGGSDENGQTFTYNLSGNTNSALFTAGGQPTISPTGVLTYTPAPNANGSATITVSVTDSGSPAATSGTQTFTINVTAVNDAPTFTLLGTQTVNEDSGAQTVTGFATANAGGGTDENGQTFTYNLSGNTNSALFTAGGQPSISPTGVLTYTPAPNAFGSATITVSVTDNGSPAATSGTQTFTINVTGINDAPSFVAGANPTILEDAGAQSVSGFASGFSPGPNEAGQQVQSYLVTNVTPSFFSSGPTVAANGTLSYTVAPNVYGTATFQLQVVDDGPTGGANVNTSNPPITVTITVTQVNDAPTFNISGNQTAAFNAPTMNVSGFASAMSPGPLDPVQALNFQVSNNNNALFQIQPTVDADGTLTYRPTANMSGTATVTVLLHDDGGTANGGVDTSSPRTFTITVGNPPANAAPTINTPPTLNINEDAGLQTVSLSGITAGGAETQNLTVTASSNNAALTGPITVAYTPNNPTGSISFTPVADANGTASITVTVTDAGVDGIAGNSDDASTSVSFTVNVAAVNDTPSFVVGGNQTVAEDAGLQTVNTFATSISRGGGSDEAGQTLTFNVSTNNNSLFSQLPAISPTGVLTYQTALNAVGTATVTVTLTDSGSGANTSAPQTFTINVTAVNDPPVFTLAGNQTVLEDAAAQTVSNFVTAVGPGGGADESAQTVSFGLTNNNNSLFSSQPQITGNSLSYTPALNANGVAIVTVTATDSLGATSTQTFTITVTAVNDAPTFTLGGNQTVLEDAGAQSVSSFITAVSPGGGSDESAQTVSFSLTNNNNLLFSSQPQIVSGALTYTPAVNANGVATVTVTATDSGGATSTQTFTITVTAVNDAPTFTMGSNQAVLEDAGPQTVGSFVTAVSPGGGSDESAQTVSFSLTNNNNSLFSSQPTITGNVLNYTPAANANGVAMVTVTATDSGGATSSQTFTITVSAVNDAPTFTLAGNQTVNEDAGAQAVSSFVTAVSPGGGSDEAAQTVSFGLTNNNNPLFSVQPSITGGVLNYTPALNANGTATVTVTATDSGGATSSQTFTITVTAVNDAPTFTVGPNQTVAYNSPAQTVANWATNITTGASNEVGQALTFTVTDNSNTALFSVQPTISAAGTLQYTPAANTSGTATITVRLSDNGGTANGGSDTSATQTFTITVSAAPVNSPPTINPLTPNPLNIQEDAGLQTISFSGVTSGTENQTITVTITSNNPGLTGPIVRNYIPNNTTGSFTFTPVANANGAATITVLVTDAGFDGISGNADDASTSTTLTVNVAAVNDTPSFVIGSNQTVNEDAGPQTVNPWATSVSRGGGADEASQVLTFNIVTNSNPGLFSALSILPTGVLTYTPALNANGSAVITVSLSDDGGGANTTTTQSFTINVNPVNDAPTFTLAGNQTVNEDAGPQVVTGFVATSSPGGGPDEAGQTLTYRVTANSNTALFSSQPTISSTGTLQYTPFANAVGTATITVIATDSGLANSTPQTFTITVNAVNDPPTFIGGTNTLVPEDSGPATFASWASQISAGPSDEASQTLNFNVTANSNPGLFSAGPSISPNGTLTFTPAANANGAATISVQLQDSAGGLSSVYSFTITVSALNDIPSFTVGPNQTVAEDAGPQTVPGWATNISAGPPDEASQTLTFNVLTNSNSGLFSSPPTVSSNGTLQYTPAANASGTATITVNIVDNGGGGTTTSASQTFTITVTPVNDAPTFTRGQNLTINEDAGPQSLTWATSISPGPSDESSQTTSFAITANSNPSLFSAGPTLSSTGVLQYTPAPNANGVANITVVLSDSAGASGAPVTFSITVNSVNDVPSFAIGGNQTIAFGSGAQTVPNFATLISTGPANESGQTVQFNRVNVGNPALFSVAPAISADGTLTYTPSPTASGTSSVTFTISDDGGTAFGGVNTSTSQSFTITITAQPINAPPTMNSISNVNINEDAGLQTVSLSGITAGGSESQALTVTVSSSDPNIVPTLTYTSPNTTGTINFTPPANYFTTVPATITVTVRDTGLNGIAGDSDDGITNRTFSVTVNPVNDTPSFTIGANQTVDEDAGPQTVTGFATGISAGPANEASQVLSFNIVGNNNSSLFSVQPTISSTGTLTYTPAANAFGTATISVTLSDNGGGASTSATQTFTITVNSVNDAPTFTPGTNLTVNEDAGPQSLVWASAISAGPSNESSQTVSFSITGNTNPGLFSAGPTLASNGVLTYTPAANANGSANITVLLTDSAGGTAAPVTFTITVNPVNDAPSFVVGGNQTIPFGSGAQTVTNFATSISAGPTNESSQTVQFNIVGNSNPGLFLVAPSIAPNGTLTYTPAAAANGTATITVNISDNGGTAFGGVNTSGNQTFTITITAQPINALPTINPIGNVNINEDAGPQTVSLSGITAGGSESQALTVTASSSDPNIVPTVTYTSPSTIGSIAFTPPADYFTSVPATITVTVRDTGLNGIAGDSDDGITTRTFTVTVNAVNDTPSFTVGANQTVNEDSGPQTVPGFATGISAGPANEASQTLTFNIVGNNNSSLFSVQPTISSTGTLTYTPAANAFGSATISVTLSDNGGGASTTAAQTFTITVNPVNDVPSFTVGPNQFVNEDAGPQTVSNFAQGISVGPPNEGGQTVSFTVTGNSNPALFSTVPSISTNGTLTYTPAANANGTATITFRIADSGGTANGGIDTSATQSFTITVNAVNDTPTFTIGANQTVNEDAGPQTVNPWATAISAGPADEAGQILTFNIVGNNNPALFSAQPTISSTGVLNYTPAPNAFGTATISITLSDNGGGASTTSTQQFTITVNPVNDVPSFTVGPNQTVSEDAGPQSVGGFAQAISFGPANEAGQTVAFTVTANSNPSLFSVAPSVSPTGVLTYTPAANASGTATITLRIADSGGTANGGVDTSATQTFTITVNGVNDTPSFVAGPSQTVNEDAGPQTVNPWATAISAGPADEAGQILTFNIVGNSNPTLFSAQPSISSTGVLTYTPAPNAFGSATISVTLSDNGGGANTTTTQQFTITVNPVNDAPSFVLGPNQIVNEDAGGQTVSGFASALSFGPANESGQAITINITGNDNPALFSAQPTISPSGTLSYTPAPNAFGVATITVTVSDNGGTANGGVNTSAPQTFTITVNPVNDAPTFTPGPTQNVNEDAGAQTVNGWASAISAGPANESSQTVSFLITGNSNPALFSAGPAISPTGVLSYTPAPNASGTAVLSVQLTDSAGGSSTVATLTINVAPVNDAPSFTAGANQTVNEDAGAQSISGWATGISVGPANESTQTLTFSVTGNTNPALFSAAPAVSPTGVLTYTSAPNANGTATITLVAVDNGGTANGGVNTSAPQTFTITVNAVNDAPDAADSTFTTPINTPLNATVIVTDPDGPTLTYTLGTLPLLGTVTNFNTATGQFTYTPTTGATGLDTFTFSVTDGTSTDTATVRISIQSAQPIVTASGGNIEVLGTTADDTVIISRGPTGQALVRTSSGSFSASANYPLAPGGTITLSTGDGRDYIVVNGITNPVSIDAGAGNDYISSGTGDDFIVGGAGDDQINASGGNNIVWGDEIGQQDLATGGNDTLSSLAGNDIMYGGGGNDQIYPGDGDDYVYAGQGNDTVSAGGGNDRVYGGAGNDLLGGDGGDDILSGGSGNDYLIGGDGNDVLIGGAGGGGDSLNGNAGNDLLIAGDTTNSQSSLANDSNDTALMALLANWNATHGAGIASGIVTGDDGAVDSLTGDTGDDDFYATLTDSLNDFNGMNMGTDRRFP
ncbi:beta strand repeat-containing protein [Anatilimnocola floriformis]|uniref:beta strand repeat-containing protein n=1 Tax=Anatilimnocola floriformis TaxID=2948575 RepID=UPI0020C33A81|nr:Ig-like domain-containing protein [Anatilimnocola floriformis]